MKVRNGFVSNSSSSSFLIVGREVGWKEYTELRHKAAGLPHLVSTEGLPYTDDMFDEYPELEKEATVVIGFGSICGGGGPDDVSVELLQEYISEAQRFFGRKPVRVFYGERGSDY